MSFQDFLGQSDSSLQQMPGRNAFPRLYHNRWSVNGIQYGFDSEALPCCFYAVDDQSRWTGRMEESQQLPYLKLSAGYRVR